MRDKKKKKKIDPYALLLTSYLILPTLIAAHQHHNDAPSDPTQPIDAVLSLHMLLQAVVWTILFPLTVVLGLIRHRLHVPLATLSLALTTLGYFLGHVHKGRSFPHTAHGTLANLLVFYLLAQTTLGFYLKLHLRFGQDRVRPVALFLHGLLGKTFPLLGWLQMILGVSTLQSWCFGGHLGQCLAHYIMGSAFIAYSLILLIMLKAGAHWLSRRGQSQEWFDSWVITLWGAINALTEHQGGPWTHKDLQHTLLGVVWFFGGLVSVWTSRRGKRSVFPGVIIGITGWAMSGHAQKWVFSKKIHSLFGYVLMAAGLARIIEVCFVLNDRPTGEHRGSHDATSTGSGETDPHSSSVPGPEQLAGKAEWTPVRAFQLLPPYLLTTSGMLFMSSTDEELRWADSSGVDHITWALIDCSIAFFLFLWFNVLLELYTTHGGRQGVRILAMLRRKQQQQGEEEEEGEEAAAPEGRGGQRWYTHLGLPNPTTTSTRRNRTSTLVADEALEMDPLSPSSERSPSESGDGVHDDPLLEGERSNHILFSQDEIDDSDDVEGKEEEKKKEEEEDPFDDERLLSKVETKGRR